MMSPGPTQCLTQWKHALPCCDRKVERLSPAVGYLSPHCSPHSLQPPFHLKPPFRCLLPCSHLVPYVLVSTVHSSPGQEVHLFSSEAVSQRGEEYRHKCQVLRVEFQLHNLQTGDPELVNLFVSQHPYL